MDKKSEIHIAKPQEKPIRLQEYGVGIFPTLPTKSALKKAIKKKLILVDGKLGETSTFINGNEEITFNPSEEKQNRKRLILPLDVVYEDDYLAIINKPAGILVSGNSFKTIANGLEQNISKSKQHDAVKPQPVHRLDYATTGLVLIGKTSASISTLSKLFEHKEITKTYYAVAIGKMDTEGTISFPIDDKEALSEFSIVNTVNSERFRYLNLVKLKPKTGRRHQLRKHLATIGNPILGDADYFQEGLILKGKGLYLHAFSLEFTHPFTKEQMQIEKALPSKFEKLFS